MPDTFRLEYERRMHRVLQHVDRHLGDPLDLAALAAVAHFSPYHFHRLFAAWTGETLGAYLRRRRLEVGAAKLLSQPRLSVLQAALAVGFGSGEAFSRAFKTHFGLSPATWRAQRNPDHAMSKPDHDGGSPGPNNGASPTRQEVTIEVRIIERAAATVACLRHVGPYGKPVNDFWRTTVYPWLAANGLLGSARYGVGHDDPDITPVSRCRYDACVELASDQPPPPASFIATIPAGRYAVTPFEGDVAHIERTWTRLLRDWLPSSGLQLDDRPCYEYYAPQATSDAATGAFQCDLCVPVAPL
jgi:AraC family transcriptional regulator